MDASNMLSQLWRVGNCIGATTLMNIANTLKDAAGAAVPSGSVAEPTKRRYHFDLRLGGKYELHHGIRITDLLGIGADLSDRHISDRFARQSHRFDG